MRDNLIDTLRDCANALGELLPRDHAYRKIIDKANRLLDRHDQSSSEQRAADALRGLMDALPAGMQTSMFGSRSVEFSVRDNLVEADTTGNIYPNAEAVAFSEAVAAAIKAKLVAGAPEFGLMPYRYNGNYLGFDWIDAEKNSISIVFYTTPNAQPLPTCIDPEGADVGVSSWIDALLLIRMIADRVKGDSIGDV